MITGLVDHLWQSCCCSGAVCAFAWLSRGNAAIVRLWLWRIALLKWIFPFALLDKLGEWLGYPVSHTTQPLPPSLVEAIHRITPYTSPARIHEIDGALAAIAAAAGLGVAGLSIRWLVRQIRREMPRVAEQERRIALDPDDKPRSIGFFRAAALSAFGAVIVAAPMISGAAADRQWRLGLLAENSRTLVDAPVSMNEAAPGMGARSRIIASEDGVVIRNASIWDLVAIVYGVNRYAVWIDQAYMADDNGKVDAWMSAPRYDVHVRSPIREPAEFDAYALRQPVTRLLVEKFGLGIYVNGKCEPPCGDYSNRR